MTPIEELKRLRKEARKLRQENAVVRRSRDAHLEKNETFVKQVTTQKKKIKVLTEENNELKKEITDLKCRLGIEENKADMYKGMIFKANVSKHTDRKGRGGITGHKGNSRKRPDNIDSEVDVCLTNCYDCGNKLNPTPSVDERVVEDIPQATTTVTLYRIQREWCASCRKEVRAVPQGTIPGSRFGINTLAFILILKYRLRTPLKKIEEILQSQYSLSITSQGIQEILHTTKTKFTKQYNDILEEIRRAPFKHADETGWRIDGKNGWCWLFATPKATFYTIEETRGKGVPHRIMGRDPTGVIIRDDCGSYMGLPMEQQSCWTHLLRVSHDATEKDGASKEVVNIHKELKMMFDEIEIIRCELFKTRVRKRHYNTYLAKIDDIIDRKYKHKDVKAVQTRVKNQRHYLVTAILYDGVPLTNNHAERMIRPMVITRKISGGSRSNKGAASHSVNMSIMQTLALRGKNFLEGISEIIHAENPRYVLGKGW